MISIINLTPHNVNVGSKTFERFGDPVRVSTTSKTIFTIGGVDIVETGFGETLNLPEKTFDTYFIVSRVVMSANPDRRDLLVPGELIRDEGGNIIGCKNLSRS